MNEKSYKNILIYYMGYLKITENLEIYSVNPLELIFSKMKGYFQENIRNKYLTLIPTNERKEKIKKYEELWIKIRDLIRSVTKNLDVYDESYLKIKFDSDDELPLNKIIGIPVMAIVVRAVFLKINKYYPQFFLDECLYKI